MTAVTLPQPADADCDTDEGAHIYCDCDPDVAFCGADVAGFAEDFGPAADTDCVLCVVVRDAHDGCCPRCLQ